MAKQAAGKLVSYLVCRLLGPYCQTECKGHNLADVIRGGAFFTKKYYPIGVNGGEKLGWLRLPVPSLC
jgi:hypothetical protein